MGDRTSVQITIGGTIKRSDLEDLVAAMIEDYCGADYRGFENEEDAIAFLEAEAKAGRAATLQADEVNYGELDAVEARCRDLGLPYARFNGSGGSYGAAASCWEPGMAQPREWPAGDGEPMLGAREIRELLKAGKLDAELQDMDRLTEPPPLVIEGQRIEADLAEAGVSG